MSLGWGFLKHSPNLQANWKGLGVTAMTGDKDRKKAKMSPDLLTWSRATHLANENELHTSRLISAKGGLGSSPIGIIVFQRTVCFSDCWLLWLAVEQFGYLTPG